MQRFCLESGGFRPVGIGADDAQAFIKTDNSSLKLRPEIVSAGPDIAVQSLESMGLSQDQDKSGQRDHFESVRLTTCPQCGYSLEGLPTSYRCPECGFAYDDLTFVLSGIPRGTGGMTIGRWILWILVGLSASLGPQSLLFLLRRRTSWLATIAGVIGIAWVALVVYLLMTRKHEKRGIARFLFAAGGFGGCTAFSGADLDLVDLTPWERGQIIRWERKSARWHRLRIGKPAATGDKLDAVQFDALVRCDATLAARIAPLLENRVPTA